MKNDNVKYSAEIVNEFLKWQTYSCLMWIALFIAILLLGFWFIGYSKRNLCDDKDDSMLNFSQVLFFVVAFITFGVISFFSYRLVHIITAPNHYVIENLYNDNSLQNENISNIFDK